MVMEKQATDQAGGRVGSGPSDTGPYTAREAAALLGVNERTVRRAIARGALSATRHGGSYRIWPADLADFQADHATPGALVPSRSKPPAPLQAGQDADLS